jgi:hypothetical protein
VFKNGNLRLADRRGNARLLPGSKLPDYDIKDRSENQAESNSQQPANTAVPSDRHLRPHPRREPAAGHRE